MNVSYSHPNIRKVFISHASKNFKLADEIRAGLEKTGIECWIAPRDIPPGSSYGEEITTAIQQCLAVIFVLTEEANLSKAIANELELAFRCQRVIVPVRINPVEPANSLAFFINNTQWVDACYTPLKKRIDEIARMVAAIEIGQVPPAPQPEKKTIFGSIERRIEGLFRYKFLTLTVVLTLLLAVTSMVVFTSSKTLSRLNVEQELINQDPTTFGLVNLTVMPADESSTKKIDLRATVYLNLKDLEKAKLTWQAFYLTPGSLPTNIDISALGSFLAPGAQVLSLSVPPTIQEMVFCMTAIHPNVGKPYIAKWHFAIKPSVEGVTIIRKGVPKLEAVTLEGCL
jgi:hypothetical protein